MSGVDLSVVVPCFNEARRIEATLIEILGGLRERGAPFEVLVVDDGSTDRTAAFVTERFGEVDELSVVQLPANRGKGGAVREGMARARGRLRLFADADGSTPFDQLAHLERAVDAGAAVAVGSRLDRSLVEARFHRWLVGWVFRTLIRALAVRSVRDTQCGFKLFTEEAAQELFARGQVDGYAFDVELLFLAEQLGYRIDEVHVRWKHQPGSKVRVVRDGLAMLGEVLRMRRLHRSLRRPIS